MTHKSEGHEDIESSKAPLIEHLIELRRRLIWSLLAVFLAFLVCFWSVSYTHLTLPTTPYV